MSISGLVCVELYAFLHTCAGTAICLREALSGKVGVIFIPFPIGIKYEGLWSGERPERPDSLLLLSQVLSAMGGEVRAVLINKKLGAVFGARIKVEIVKNDGTNELLELESRPTDAFGLAILTGAPIRVLPEVWNRMEDVSLILGEIKNNTQDGRKPVYL